jgi:FkbM family methyltransferase
MYGDKYISFAQNAEDVRIFGYLRKLDKPGFYIDIGANHPVEDSVTKFFYERGWHGINIEPQSDLIELLNVDRQRDINILSGVSDKKGTLNLRKYSGHGLSTFSKSLKNTYEESDVNHTKQYEDIKVPVDTLSNILNKYLKNKEVQFMKVDVEGFEYQTLISNDWKKYRPWIICVEATGSDKRWKATLKNAKYTLHIFDGLNEYYVADEKAELLDDYYVYVASEVIRFDIANRPSMRFANSLRSVKKKILR